MQDRLSSFPPLQSQNAEKPRKLKPAALVCNMLQNVIKSQMSLCPPPLIQLNYYFKQSCKLQLCLHLQKLNNYATIGVFCSVRKKKKNHLMKNYVGG